MTGVNHAVGGVVFTGIFASFWNINIFSSFAYLLFTVFVSLLPDIDHTRSLIGKMFYPLAHYLDRHFRHRTVTHSLIFLISACFLSAVTESIFASSHTFTLILFFALLSHFIFDMVTLQGIPLFYPFYRNPCVIFGNPAFRLRTNSRQSEMVVLAIFILIGISCADLFRNGFWTSYNRSFGTLKHLHQENRATDKILNVEYHYFRSTVEYKGTGQLIASKETEAVIFDSVIFTLDKTDELLRIDYVRPVPTAKPKIIQEIGFYSITLDSLRSLLRDRIVSGNIQSSQPVQIFERNIRKVSNIIKLEYSYNAELTAVADTAKESIRNRLALKLERLRQNEAQHAQLRIELDNLRTKQSGLKAQSLIERDSYQKNNLQNQIISLSARITQREQALREYIPDQVLLKEIELLQKELEVDNVLFSGLLSVNVR